MYFGKGKRREYVVVFLFASMQLANADTPVISPNETVGKNLLIYQVGSTEPFTGRVVSTRYDGSKDYEEVYVNGRLHGARTEWDRLGNRISERTYVDGAITGPETYWYSSGQLMAVTNFLNGARHGPATRWCKNGEKKSEWSYVDHRKNGAQSEWYVGGQKRSESIYKDDKMTGSYTGWYRDGKIQTKLAVDNVRKIYTATRWYENGQKRCEDTGAKGEPPTRTAWDESGNRLDMDEQAYRIHCRSSLASAKLKPGEHIASVRRGPDGTTRYGTVGSETTMTKIEMSASDLERIEMRSKEVRECGLAAGMSR